jgi:hypothetical protein
MDVVNASCEWWKNVKWIVIKLLDNKLTVNYISLELHFSTIYTFAFQCLPFFYLSNTS